MHRRQFFKFAVMALGAASFVSLHRAAKLQTTKSKVRRSVRFEKSGPPVELLDDIVIVRSEVSGMRVFSRKCTHLRCRILEQNAEMLVCPCHGSMFNLAGEVIIGPARKPLAKLMVESGEGDTYLFVELID